MILLAAALVSQLYQMAAGQIVEFNGPKCQYIEVGSGGQAACTISMNRVTDLAYQGGLSAVHDYMENQVCSQLSEDDCGDHSFCEWKESQCIATSYDEAACSQMTAAEAVDVSDGCAFLQQTQEAKEQCAQTDTDLCDAEQTCKLVQDIYDDFECDIDITQLWMSFITNQALQQAADNINEDCQEQSNSKSKCEDSVYIVEGDLYVYRAVAAIPQVSPRDHENVADRTEYSDLIVSIANAARVDPLQVHVIGSEEREVANEDSMLIDMLIVFQSAQKPQFESLKQNKYFEEGADFSQVLSVASFENDDVSAATVIANKEYDQQSVQNVKAIEAFEDIDIIEPGKTEGNNTGGNPSKGGNGPNPPGEPNPPGPSPPGEDKDNSGQKVSTIAYSILGSVFLLLIQAV